MPDQSHREEMSAAIRAQRERNAVPRTIAPEPAPPPAPEPGEAVACTASEGEDEVPGHRSLFTRLRGK
jgi:hypothetical protein